MSTTATGGRLWALIEHHRTSQAYPPSHRALSQRVGITQTTLSNYRAPKGLPAREHLESLALVIGVPYRMVLSAALVDVGYLDPEEV